METGPTLDPEIKRDQFRMQEAEQFVHKKRRKDMSISNTLQDSMLKKV